MTTSNEELRRLAEAAEKPQGNMETFSIIHSLKRYSEFHAAANPAKVKAMLDQIDALTKEVKDISDVLKYEKQDAERYRKAWKGEAQ